MSSYFVENFGCRATQADGAAIERDLACRGMARAESGTEASVVVLNTCTVTAAADADVRASIRRIHRQNPECKILVTGCYAQRAPEEVAALPGVTWVVGNSHKRDVAGIIQQSASRGIIFCKLGSTFRKRASAGGGPALCGRHFCSYTTVGGAGIRIRRECGEDPAQS